MAETHSDSDSGLREVLDFMSLRRYPRWVGANLVGPEHDARGCLDVIVDVSSENDIAKDRDVCPWSVHAGELRCRNRNVLRAICVFNASRIGHGVNWCDGGRLEAETLAMLRRRNISIETVLVSNHELELLKNFKRHPLPHLLRLNVPTCLSTDDPAVWQSSFADEYVLAADILPAEVLYSSFISMGRNSLKYSFAPDPVKSQLLQKFDMNVKKFEAKMRHWQKQAGSCSKELQALRIPPSKFACRQWPRICASFSLRRAAGDGEKFFNEPDEKLSLWHASLIFTVLRVCALFFLFAEGLVLAVSPESLQAPHRCPPQELGAAAAF